MCAKRLVQTAVRTFQFRPKGPSKLLGNKVLSTYAKWNESATARGRAPLAFDICSVFTHHFVLSRDELWQLKGAFNEMTKIPNGWSRRLWK